MTTQVKPLLYFGRFFETSGYAAEARSYALGLREFGYRIQLLPLAERFACGSLIDASDLGALQAMESNRVDPSRAVTLLHQKPDTFPDTGSPARIARTTFETDRIPEGWVERLNGLTEVWVPSRFNLETFARAGVSEGRLRLVRQGIDTTRFHPGAPPLALEQRRRFTFLSTFTWQNRKGWDVLVRAYLSEFRADDDVMLLLWAQPFYHQPDEMHAELQQVVRQTPGLEPVRSAPITLLTDPCPDSAMPGLYTACDAFVLPSRGEGWGRPLAEAMACGLPTIGTAWGGNLDFMTLENSYLVETDGLVPVDEGVEVAYFRGHRWANPSVEHLRQVMRRVVDQPAEAARRGARARADMAARWDLRQTVAELATELDRFYP
jgi:glycosyltransferase involved in cell wall biosynthesis